jgi:hypothetical protein
MDKNILAVCDLEETYACQLMDYLNLKKTVPFEVQAFTVVEKLMEYAKKEKIDVLLISEEAITQELNELNIGEIFVLSEEETTFDKEGYKSIYKYQETENILREVMCYYAEAGSVIKSRNSITTGMEVIGIYSPVKRTLKTSFAMTLGQIIAKDKRTLYINLEEYAGFNSLLCTTYMTDMSDLMYYISQNRQNFIWKLASMVQSIGNMDYIPPALSPLDIKTVRRDQWISFLEEIKKCNYEVMILDLGEAVEGIFDILRICTKIYTPTRDDGVSYAKMEQYEALLKIMNYSDVLEKTRKLSFSYFKGIEYGIENLVHSELGTYVKKLLEVDEGKV